MGDAPAGSPDDSESNDSESNAEEADTLPEDTAEDEPAPGELASRVFGLSFRARKGVPEANTRGTPFRESFDLYG